MRLIRKATWTAAMFAAAISFGAMAYAQEPAPNGRDRSAGQDRAREAEGASITGELTRVMPDQKAFAVKSTSGAEMLFRYNDQTVVSGAENTVAGLATSKGAEVTVTYKNDSAGNMATKIEVHPKK